MGELRKAEKPYRRVIIAGGGNIGTRLANDTEDSYDVRIMEVNPERAQNLADQLNQAVVIQGSATDRDRSAAAAKAKARSVAVAALAL